MISKKILALVLALSVIVCALPAVSAFAANETEFPYSAETLTFTAEELAADPYLFHMTTGVYVKLDKASDSFKRMAQSKADVTDKVYMSGTINFGNVTVNIKNLPAKGFGSKGELNFWASSFAANDATLTAAMKAATEIPNMETKDDGTIDVGSTKLCIRNFKRYVYYMNGITLTPEEDSLPEGETNMDKHPLYARSISPTSAEITLTYKTARPTATAAFDVGTIYVPSAKIANAVPSVEDAENGVHAWYFNQGIYQQHKESITTTVPGTTDNYCSAGQNTAMGIDGPYYVFKATESGTYNVYCTRRDRYYKDTNGTRDTDSRRDIYINISGTDLSFASKETLPKDNKLEYRLIPEDTGKTVTLTAGQEVVVRLMDNTGAWAGSNGFILVPVGKTHDGLVGTVISADNFTSAHNYNVTAKQISEVTINTADNAAVANVTVNSNAVAAKTEGAYLKDAVKFNNIRRYDANGNYIKAPTVLDALVEADAADNTFAVDGFDTLGAVSVKLNGTPVYSSELDRTIVEEGDVITCVSVDKTNFSPISMGDVFQNYGSHGTSDALAIDGKKLTDIDNKFLTDSTVGKSEIWPVDISVRDSIAGCHLTGYVSFVKDLTSDDNYDTTGDERLVKLYIDMYIRHSAQRSGGAVEMGYDQDKDIKGAFLSDKYADLNGDGVDEKFKATIVNGKFGWFDFSNLYLVNSSYDMTNVTVTATKVADGVFNLSTTKTVPVTLVRVVKDSEGNLISTAKTHDVLDFMNAAGLNVTVAENETVYVWEGTNLPAGSTMKPLCAPLTR